MVEITFGLVRSANPEINFDEIEKLTALNLSNCSITSIDNLELFDHILELNLSNNSIKSIENLIFFRQLQHLDLSCNKITSVALVDSFPEIPKCLQSINLSGNPCAEDESVLSQLQDAFPSLGIIIDVLEDEGSLLGADAESIEQQELSLSQNEEPLESSLEEDHSEEQEKLFDPIDYDPSMPLNTEDLLKSIVERKSKLQSIESFSLNSTVSELEYEYNKAMNEENELNMKRRERVRNRIEAAQKPEEDFHHNFDNRKQRLIKNNEQEASRYDEVLERMKKTAAEHLRSIRTTSHDGNDNNDDAIIDTKEIDEKENK